MHGALIHGAEPDNAKRERMAMVASSWAARESSSRRSCKGPAATTNRRSRCCRCWAIRSVIPPGLSWASSSPRLDRLVEIFPPEQQTPETLGALQKAEIEKWWPIIKAANLKVE